jgi:glycosyltransferase involved in cell wall biosynthesis
MTTSSIPTRARMGRPHVVVLTGPGVGFADDWAAAAAPFAEITVVRTGSRAALRERDGGTSVLPVFEIDIPPLRPTRAFSRSLVRLWLSKFLRIQRDIEGRRGAIELMHGHFYSVAHRLLALKRATGIPYVLTEHSSRLTGRSAPHKPLSPTGLRLARRGYEEASAVMFVSQYLRRCAERLDLSGAFTVLGNPVQVDLFAPPTERRNGNCRVAWVGRFESDKDPSLVLRALASLRGRIPAVGLDLIGDGPDRGRIERLVSQLGIEAHVRFHGRVPRQRVAEVLKSSSVFVNTSRVETFGLGLAEAGAVGLPLIAPDLPAVRELFGGFVRTFPASDVGSLTESLVAAATARVDPWPQINHIRRYFAPHVIGERMASVYEASRRREVAA